MSGGAGNDKLVGGAGVNVLSEQIGLVSGETLVLTNTTLKGSTVVGGLGSDTLSGLKQAVIRGGVGNDKIDTSKFSPGPVTLIGGLGNDTLIGGKGNDFFDTNGLIGIGGDGADVITGGLGSNTALNDPTDTRTQIQNLVI